MKIKRRLLTNQLLWAFAGKMIRSALPFCFPGVPDKSQDTRHDTGAPFRSTSCDLALLEWPFFNLAVLKLPRNFQSRQLFEKASILRSPAALRKIRSFFYCLALRHAHVILAGLLPSPYARKILSLLPSAFRNT